jgi:succinyl-diaminopimelate desuccinylase
MDSLSLAQALIRCPSVTPHEGGALALLGAVFADAGFAVERPTFSAEGTPDIENLYARIGHESPVFLFAGHTDVVPVGDASAWKHDPFGAIVENGMLYGRGAVDMKGGVAAMVTAALRHLAENGGKPARGSIAFLITGDEEGPAINGSAKLLAWAEAKGEHFDHCVLGEPTSVERLGDTLKIGRRGSLSGALTLSGVQGHVAYPHRARNPLRVLPDFLNALMHPLDTGTDYFEASNLEITSVDTGNTAANVIPAHVMVKFNIRFNDTFSVHMLKEELHRRVNAVSGNCSVSLTFLNGASDAFITEPGGFMNIVEKAVWEQTGEQPKPSTGGGTSDARFIKNYCPVIELGPVGTTMHMVDECISVAELEKLSDVFKIILDKYSSSMSF